MWTSILKHITNIHVWQDGERAHGPFLNHNKSWIDENSPVMEELRKIVMDSKWLKSFYTKFRHTGVLESYHNAQLKYAPKRIELT